MFDVSHLLSVGGLALLAGFVFAESGLLIGFFLPGDSLLFIAGYLSSNAGGHVLPALWVTALVAFVSAVAGDQVGYLFGRRVGPHLRARQRSRFFNPANVDKAQAFFARHGSKAIVLARFVPIGRTFTPIVAGIGHMDYRTFVTFNIVGGALWGIGVTTLGYFLGEVPFIRNHLEVAALVIVAVSLLPVVIHLRRERHRRHS